jgi:hypothetical protein
VGSVWQNYAVDASVFQQFLNATAMNVVGVIAWLWGEFLGKRWWKLGHFARPEPHPLSRQTALC